MVSIIILSYNTKDYLVSLLQSLKENLRSLKYEVIVVDNASTDGTVEAIQNSKFKIQNYSSKLKIIKNERNLGFSKGANIAAREAKGEFLLFLNSDTLLFDESVASMIDYGKEHTDVGVLGGKLKNESLTPSKSFGRFYSLFQVFLMLFGAETLLSSPNNSRIVEVDWVSGGCMLIRKDLFDKVAGFDEHFFMYVEDMELCFRVKKLGYKIVYYPKTVVLHIGQGSSNRAFAISHIYEGLVYFYKKHKTVPEYAMLKQLLRTKAVLAMFFGIIVGNRELFKTYKNALSYVV